MKFRNFLRRAVWIVPLLVCTTGLVASGSAARDDEDVLQFTPWSAPLNLGSPVNSVLEETDPFISKDGLSLYFACNGCPGGFGGRDIYVSQRASENDPWGPPQNLGPKVNTSFDEGSPALSVDGHRLYFNSNRLGGFGAGDIYVSRRHNKRDDFGWQDPENLGSGVNTDANENQPCIFEDDDTGIITLYFTSKRPGGMGGDDIYASTLQPDETFGPAAPVLELSTSSEDRSVTIRRDGLELIFLSNRPGSILNAQGLPSFDLWVSTRVSTPDPWSQPVNVDPLGLLGVNTGRHDGGPALSFDGKALYFHAAQRPGNLGVGCPNGSTCFFDIWMATRTKLEEPD
ncbi:PD40 domain-containing protein [Candidatus Micrarchaeota archaeon]|nr:PD40 domain-containing protein [Candidatus Micrarchaeota archaeon]